MFTKSKETEVATGHSASPRRAQRTNVPSIISGDLTVSGTLISSGDVQIDGRVEGDIRATALVIGEEASIQGDVYAEDAVIRGRVEGSVRAKKVQLCATAHVEGNILHEALSVEAGAFFEGNCRHSDNPLSDAPQLNNGAAGKAPVQPAKPVAVAVGQKNTEAVSAAPNPVGTATPIRTEDSRPASPPARATASFTPIKG